MTTALCGVANHNELGPRSMHEIADKNFPPRGDAARSQWTADFRAAISEFQTAQDRQKSGLRQIRQTDRLVKRYKQEADAAGLDDPRASAAAFEKAIGKRDREWITAKLPLIMAHKILTNSGRSFEEAANFMVALRPAIAKRFKLRQLRVDFDRHRPDLKSPIIAAAFEEMGGDEATDHILAIKLILAAKL